MLEAGINMAKHSIAYIHTYIHVFLFGVLYNKQYLNYRKIPTISLSKYKPPKQPSVKSPFQKSFALFFGSQKLLFWRRGATPPPNHPPTMHISAISTSAFIKTCDTSVVLKLQCLKMQACSLVIISVQSSRLMESIYQGRDPSDHFALSEK